MNLIPMIAKELGVEVGEEFKIRPVDTCGFNNSEFVFRFVEDEMEHKNNGYWIRTPIPTALIEGKSEIVKLPFEPKRGEVYWFVSLRTKQVGFNEWVGRSWDYMAKYCGNCFRTEKEAEKHKYEIYEKLTGKKWEENESTD